MTHYFNLTDEMKTVLLDAIKQYYAEEKGEAIGDLAAMLLLDFFTEKLAPVFYNLGVEDAHAFLHAKLDDVFEIQKI